MVFPPPVFTVLSPSKVEPKMSSQVLSKMLELIKNGQLSQEDVIEEMINNGLLPVDVTEIGKIPISVGMFGRSIPLKSENVPEQVITGKAEIPPKLKLQNVRARKPASTTTTTTSLPIHDDMIDVDLSDPDGDFENMSEQLQDDDDQDDMKGVDPGLMEAGPPPPGVQSGVRGSVKNEKDIDVLDSMMKLFDQASTYRAPPAAKWVLICRLMEH